MGVWGNGVISNDGGHDDMDDESHRLFAKAIELAAKGQGGNLHYEHNALAYAWMALRLRHMPTRQSAEMFLDLIRPTADKSANDFRDPAKRREALARFYRRLERAILPGT